MVASQYPAHFHPHSLNRYALKTLSGLSDSIQCGGGVAARIRNYLTIESEVRNRMIGTPQTQMSWHT